MGQIQNEKKVLAIVVTYNAEEWLDTCLTSLSLSNYPVDIAIVDNNSSDDTVSIIKEEYGHLVKYLYEMNDNLGFGKAHNIVFEESYINNYDFVFLLNQDAAIGPSALLKMVKVLKEFENIYILSPIHYHSEGIMEKGFAKYFNSNDSQKIDFGGYEIKLVSCVNAAIWLMPTVVFKSIGKFDPLFDHYGEDTNYAHRVINKGFKIGILKDAVGFHFRPQQIIGSSRQALGKKFYASQMAVLLNPGNSFVSATYSFFKSSMRYSIKHIYNFDLNGLWDHCQIVIKILKLWSVIIGNRKT